MPAAQAPAAPVPAAPSPSPAPPVASPAPAAAAPAASSGSPVVKIVLIVVAVLIFLGLVSAGACVYFVYRAKQKVHEFESKVHATFPMPTGTREVRTQPAAPSEAPGQETAPAIDMGVPVYPGAEATGGSGELPMGLGGVKVQQYSTGDSVDKVVAFYKEKLGSKAVVTQSGDSALVQVMGSNGVINITVAPDSNSGKTKFTITSIGK